MLSLGSPGVYLVLLNWPNALRFKFCLNRLDLQNGNLLLIWAESRVPSKKNNLRDISTDQKPTALQAFITLKLLISYPQVFGKR